MTTVMKDRLVGSGFTNLTSERNFGSLDSSMTRRPNAGLHYHSTLLLFKSNKCVIWAQFYQIAR